MPDRPSDLPDFTKPPVTEVVLGVQFNSIEGFLTPHLGTIWERFRDQFPTIEEQPALVPVFETFGQSAAQALGIKLQLMTGAEMPRVFFVHRDRTQLIQVQRDRFLHNWRKVGAGDAYPRFERMLQTFEDGYRKVTETIAGLTGKEVVPNQCEVTYINQFEIAPELSTFDNFERLFGHFSSALTLPSLGKPEDARFMLRYVIKDSTGVPLGRLIVSAEPARRVDGVAINQLTLTARGRPVTLDAAGVVGFLKIGRREIVHGFADLTSAEMHKKWGRVR